MSDQIVTGAERISPKSEGQSAAAAEPAPASVVRRVSAWLLHELYDILPPVIFFFIGFNLIVLTTNLILADYSMAVGNFMLATAAALVVGKAVLVADTMPFLGRYDRAPLLEPILYKTLVYWAFVFVARLLEALVEFCVKGHPLREFLPHLASTFSWHRFAAIQIWIMVLFLIYVTASELNRLFGAGELRRIFLKHRPSELRLNRRQRIRELVHLSQLADAHPLDELSNPASLAHRQLIDIVRRLAREPQARHLAE